VIEESHFVFLEPFLPLTTSRAVKSGLIAVFLSEELLAATFANHIHIYTSRHVMIYLPISTDSFAAMTRACSYWAFHTRFISAFPFLARVLYGFLDIAVVVHKKFGLVQV
jgi:hypothetical protein